jgi:hypothetical protein
MNVEFFEMEPESRSLNQGKSYRIAWGSNAT